MNSMKSSNDLDRYEESRKALSQVHIGLYLLGSRIGKMGCVSVSFPSKAKNATKDDALKLKPKGNEQRCVGGSNTFFPTVYLGLLEGKDSMATPCQPTTLRKKPALSLQLKHMS
jgi:hypothetical protein